MTMTSSLLNALKQQMRARQVTYKAAAEALELSEASVKRLFSEENISLTRLERLCELAGISMSELVALAESQRQSTGQLTVEQEQAIVDNPKLLLVGVCLINQYTFEEILSKYRMDEPELIQLFVQLDRLNIIELLPNNHYRLKLSPNFSWQPGGPIQRFFIESMVKEYMVGEMQTSNNHLHFVWGMLSEDAGAEIQRKLREIVDDYVQLTSQKPRNVERHNSSLLVLFRENWEPSLFKAHWQEKHGLK